MPLQTQRLVVKRKPIAGESFPRASRPTADLHQNTTTRSNQPPSTVMTHLSLGARPPYFPHILKQHTLHPTQSQTRFCKGLRHCWLRDTCLGVSRRSLSWTMLLGNVAPMQETTTHPVPHPHPLPTPHPPHLEHPRLHASDGRGVLFLSHIKDSSLEPWINARWLHMCRYRGWVWSAPCVLHCKLVYGLVD